MSPTISSPASPASQDEKRNSFLLEDLLDQSSARRSALKRAAKISPQVKSLTLGPKSLFRSETPPKESPTVVVTVTDARELEHKNTQRNVTLVTADDLKAMQNRLHQKTEERKLQEKVRIQMELRNQREQELYKSLQLKIELMKLEAERKHVAKMEALERQIEAALKLDEKDESEYQKRRSDITNNNRKLLQEQQEKDLRENLRRLDEQFDKLEASFNKILQCCPPETAAITDMFKKQFIDIKGQKNVNRSLESSKHACRTAEELCHSLLKTKKDFEAQKAQKEEEQLQAHAQALAAQEAALIQQEIDQQARVVASHVNIQAEDGSHFNQLMQFLVDKQNATKELSEAAGLQELRFALKLAVNNPINMLNEQNKSTLEESFHKLHSLLSGKVVTTTKGNISTAHHHEASDWIKLRIAEKLIDACDKKSATTFFVAALTVALWQQFPDFGRIFIAVLFKECPFLMPHKPPRISGKSDSEFLNSWGYRLSDQHKPEPYPIYQQRTSNFATLLAAIWITNSRRGEETPNPCGIDNSWIYLINVMNKQPEPMYLHFIDKVLEIAGSTMHMTFSKQFVKAIRTLQDQYLPAVESRVDENMKGAFDRLRDITIARFFTAGQFAPPKGKLPINFW